MEFSNRPSPGAPYLRQTISIKGIKFTPREIDVLACIVSGRRDKTIASFLDIAPKTVETHTRNIMSKLGCNSRESIINFVEQSGHYRDVKTYYSSLLARLAFKKILKEIQKEVSEEKNLVLVHNMEKTSLLLQEFKQDLKALGVNVVIPRKDLSPQSHQEISLEIIDNQMVLDNKACTYHMSIFETLQKLYPQLNLEPYEAEFNKQVYGLENKIEEKDVTNFEQKYSIFSLYSKYWPISILLFGSMILVLSSFYWEKSNKPGDQLSPITQTLKTDPPP